MKITDFVKNIYKIKVGFNFVIKCRFLKRNNIDFAFFIKHETKKRKQNLLSFDFSILES